MIAPSDIPNADPTELIKQYQKYVFKLANRYTKVLERSGTIDLDDLHQAGYLAILDAQKKYDPERGDFLNLLYYVCRKYMRETIGYNNATGKLPKALTYLDAPLNDETDDTLMDTIPDDGPEIEEAYLEDEARQETAKAVRDAIDRLKSETEREAVKLYYLEGKTEKDAAAEMGKSPGALHDALHRAKKHLYRDAELKDLIMPDYLKLGSHHFSITWTSAVEAAVLWREEHIWNRLAKWDRLAEEA